MIKKLQYYYNPIYIKGVKEDMSKKMQTTKNIELTQKLISYLVKGKNVPDLPKDVSLVPFSKTDKKLNRANQELLEKIPKEDKPVVIATEPETIKGSWIITPVNF